MGCELHELYDKAFGSHAGCIIDIVKLSSNCFEHDSVINVQHYILLLCLIM